MHICSGVRAPETASCGGRVRKLKENLQLPHESHTITQDESKEEHSGSARGKCEPKKTKKKKPQKNEKVKAAVWMCLIFIMAVVCVRS